MELRAFILRKDKRIRKQKASTKKGYIKYGRGAYLMEAEGINTFIKDARRTGSEIFFWEGNPIPLAYKEPEKQVSAFMDKEIYHNALEQTGKSEFKRLGETFGFISPLFRPANFIIFVLFAIIIISVLRGGLI